jgi:hypothetical protein
MLGVKFAEHPLSPEAMLVSAPGCLKPRGPLGVFQNLFRICRDRSIAIDCKFSGPPRLPNAPRPEHQGGVAR